MHVFFLKYWRRQNDIDSALVGGGGSSGGNNNNNSTSLPRQERDISLATRIDVIIYLRILLSASYKIKNVIFEITNHVSSKNGHSFPYCFHFIFI